MCMVESMLLLLLYLITVLTCEHTCSGDAYIVVSWLLSDDEEDSILNEERIEVINTKRCIDMLKVADGLLSCLEEHREKTGIDLHGRIGVATGVVISGVVGLLQPRFCVFVHCSTEFLQFVAGDHSVAIHRKPSINAELLLEYSTRMGRLRQESTVIVSRMEKAGKLLRQQNEVRSQGRAALDPD